MGNNFKLFAAIILVFILTGCKENVNGPDPKNKLEGKWVCEFSYISIGHIGGDIPDTLLSFLEFKQDSFSVNIVKSYLNSDGTFYSINKTQYQGSYSISGDTIKFYVSADVIYLDRFSFKLYDDSLKIDGETKPGSGGSFVRVKAFLWNYSDNMVNGTFYRVEDRK